MATTPRIQKEKLYDAAMDAFFECKPEGLPGKIGETIGELSSITGRISPAERNARSYGSQLVGAVMKQQLAEKGSEEYVQALIAIQGAQHAMDTFFKFSPEGPGARDGISKQTLLITGAIRHAVQVNLAEQREAGEMAR